MASDSSAKKAGSTKSTGSKDNKMKPRGGGSQSAKGASTKKAAGSESTVKGTPRGGGNQSAKGGAKKGR